MARGPQSAWYLSIVGVAPAAQDTVSVRRIIELTLAESDEAGPYCYQETLIAAIRASASGSDFLSSDRT